MTRRASQTIYRTNLLGPSAVGPGQSVRGPSRAGLAVILLFLAVFAGWGGLAPLAGGAVASGVIAPSGSVRTVQHLEGGIVERILVHDGDTVAAGAPLVELRSIAAETEVAALLDRRRARRALEARLEAEIADSDVITFPADLRADPAAETVMDAETRILKARIAIVDTSRRTLDQRIQQLEQQILGYRAQVDSSDTQLALVSQEIGDKTTLLEQGLTPKVDLLRLQRDAAQIRGFAGEYASQIAAAQQQIGEAKIEQLGVEAQRVEDVSAKVVEVRGELAEIEQTLQARRDVLARTMVVAPVAGVVSNLRIKTEGGVIGAGQPVLDIVPSQERLVIDVAVSPMDIDVVKTGMHARVHFSALDRRTPQVEGVVTNVSADSLISSENRAPHYYARVEVAREELQAKGVGELLVGMPAEVIIVSRERTMVEYLLEPFTDALRRAGREV